ncbi:RING finger protein [Candidatus Dependentiae bacterium]|nr:RING finger protein [Candidatus Dependentiae bacterium]
MIKRLLIALLFVGGLFVDNELYAGWCHYNGGLSYEEALEWAKALSLEGPKALLAGEPLEGMPFRQEVELSLEGTCREYCLDESCPICLESFGEETLVSILPCKHAVCEGCLKDQLKHAHDTINCRKCPTCRAYIADCLEKVVCGCYKDLRPRTEAERKVAEGRRAGISRESREGEPGDLIFDSSDGTDFVSNFRLTEEEIGHRLREDARSRVLEQRNRTAWQWFTGLLKWPFRA